MKRSGLILSAAVVLAACASMIAPGDVKSLRGADAAAPDQAPAVHKQLGAKPGNQPKIARTFEGQPPLIPHATDNFDEVTLADNQCLECHGEATYKQKNAPRLSDSHFVGADGKRQQVADARRYACVLCHAPQFDAPPLVESTFVGTLLAAMGRSSEEERFMGGVFYWS